MAESKHKVGDKVLIKDTDWYKRNTIVDTEGFFRTSVRLLCPVMFKYLDTICTVSAVLGDGEYLLAETGCLRWTDEMFEEVPQHLFKKMISLEDACEWLSDHGNEYRNNPEELVIGFRKAMEEQRI